MKNVDTRGPVAVNARTRVPFHAGIGPHSENEAIGLIAAELSRSRPEDYSRYRVGVPYPSNSRQKCDLCLGFDLKAPAIEIKMLRLLGDNGKLNDNMLMHILSPYPQHRSALTDCQKLLSSGFEGTKVIVIYAFDTQQFPAEAAIRAFEVLARDRVRLSERSSAEFTDLIHPIHTKGAVFAWALDHL